MSLKVFIRKEDIPAKAKVVYYSQFYFKEHLREYLPNLKMDETFEGMLYEIDEAKYIGNGNIENDFGEIVSLELVSAGCMTAVNVYKNPNKVIDTVLCGGNALDEIFKLNKGYILMENRIPVIHQDKIDVVLCYGDKKYKYTEADAFTAKLHELLHGGV